jgi:hypothetical protein
MQRFVFTLCFVPVIFCFQIWAFCLPFVRQSRCRFSVLLFDLRSGSVSLWSVRSWAVRHRSKLSLTPFVFRQIRPPRRRLVFVCCFPFDLCFPRQRLRFSPTWTAKDFLARFFLQLLVWSPRSTSWSLLFSLCYRRLKPCTKSLVCWFGPVIPRLILLYCFVLHCSVSWARCRSHPQLSFQPANRGRRCLLGARRALGKFLGAIQFSFFGLKSCR